jgi:hypothetical protein
MSVPAESSAARQKTNIRLFILASLAVEDGDRLREKRSSFFYEVDRLEVLSVGVAFKIMLSNSLGQGSARRALQRRTAELQAGCWVRSLRAFPALDPTFHGPFTEYDYASFLRTRVAVDMRQGGAARAPYHAIAAARP